MVAPAFINWVGGAYQPDTWTWAKACTTYPVPSTLRVVDTLIFNLKEDSVWSLLDWLLFCAADTEQAGLVNVKNPAKVGSNVNLTTFTANRGFTGDAVSMHLSFLEQLAAGAGNQFSLNNASMGVYVNQQNSTTSKVIFNGSGNVAFIGVRAGSAATTFSVNDGTTSTLVASSTTKLGSHAVNRNAASGASSKQGYRDGSLVADLNVVSTSVGSANNARVLRDHSSNYDDSRVAAVWSGGSMTGTQQLAIHNHIVTALTAVGAN